MMRSLLAAGVAALSVAALHAADVKIDVKVDKSAAQRTKFGVGDSAPGGGGEPNT